MKASAIKIVSVAALATIGIAIGAAGVYVGQIDDAPGAGGIGLLIMIGMLIMAVKRARRDA
jgi:hypothetical protein